MKHKVFYFDCNGRPLPYSECYDMAEEIDDARAEKWESEREDSFEAAEENESENNLTL